MLKGCNPHTSLNLIHEVDLYNEIFAPPIQDLPILPVQDMMIAADIMCCRIFGFTSSHSRIYNLLKTSSERYLAWLIAAMSPWKNQSIFLADNNTPAAATAIEEGLRCPNSESRTIAKAFANQNVIVSMVIKAGNWGRGKLGLEMRALGANWKNQVGACLVFELMDLKHNNNNGEGEEIIMDIYETFLKTIAEKGLEEAVDFKSFLKVSPPIFLPEITEEQLMARAIRAMKWQRNAASPQELGCNLPLTNPSNTNSIIPTKVRMSYCSGFARTWMPCWMG